MSQVLIVGATSEVASHVAVRLAQQGHKIFCLGRSQKKMTTLAQKLGQSMIGHHCLDFRDHDAVFAAIHSAQESLQTIDMVLIAHGDLGNQAATQEDYSLAFQTYETNLLSVIRFLLPLSAALAGQGHGKIAVITSVAGDRGRPRNYTYGSAKGALSLYLQGMRSTRLKW